MQASGSLGHLDLVLLLYNTLLTEYRKESISPGLIISLQKIDFILFIVVKEFLKKFNLELTSLSRRNCILSHSIEIQF